MEVQKYEFEATQSLSLGNSFGTIREEDNVKLQVTVGIKSKHGGWFEVYDIETGGDDWYAEGCLEFDGMDLVGYDGCFSLPEVVIDKLKTLGYKDDL
tara:strand:+ start:5980 stop:6270 length:291 start_codon:yes stop_codon:yes gene_type:complete